MPWLECQQSRNKDRETIAHKYSSEVKNAFSLKMRLFYCLLNGLLSIWNSSNWLALKQIWLLF